MVGRVLVEIGMRGARVREEVEKGRQRNMIRFGAVTTCEERQRRGEKVWAGGYSELLIYYLRLTRHSEIGAGLILVHIENAVP